MNHPAARIVRIVMAVSFWHLGPSAFGATPSYLDSIIAATSEPAHFRTNNSFLRAVQLALLAQQGQVAQFQIANKRLRDNGGYSSILLVAPMRQINEELLSAFGQRALYRAGFPRSEGRCLPDHAMSCCAALPSMECVTAYIRGVPSFLADALELVMLRDLLAIELQQDIVADPLAEDTRFDNDALYLVLGANDPSNSSDLVVMRLKMPAVHTAVAVLDAYFATDGFRKAASRSVASRCTNNTATLDGGIYTWRRLPSQGGLAYRATQQHVPELHLATSDGALLIRLSDISVDTVVPAKTADIVKALGTCLGIGDASPVLRSVLADSDAAQMLMLGIHAAALLEGQ